MSPVSEWFLFRSKTDSLSRVAFIVPVTPLLPGLALSIVSGGTNTPSPKALTDAGIRNLYTFNWLFGFVVSIFLYTSLSWIFPDKQTLVSQTIWALDQSPIEGQTSDEEQGRVKTGFANDGKQELAHESDAKPF